MNSRTNEKFAAKVIDSREANDKSARGKIMQEAELHKYCSHYCREMSHPSIVKFYDMFEFEGEIYMIMELCQNNSLKCIFTGIVFRVPEEQGQDYRILSQMLHASNN